MLLKSFLYFFELVLRTLFERIEQMMTRVLALLMVIIDISTSYSSRYRLMRSRHVFFANRRLLVSSSLLY